MLRENGVEDVAPTLVLGGGPAGVVELANREVVGLLVGVVVDEEFEPRLNIELPPALEVAPNTGLEFSAWLLEFSAGLLGVAKLKDADDVKGSPGWVACVIDGVKPKIPPPLEELFIEGCPKLNSPDAGLLTPPNGLLDPPLDTPDPKIEGA